MSVMSPEGAPLGWSPANPEIRVSIQPQDEAAYLGDALLADFEAGIISREELGNALDRLFPEEESAS